MFISRYRQKIAAASSCLVVVAVLLFDLPCTVGGDYSDYCDDEDLLPIRVQYAGSRMSSFFAKLNALRREQCERRQESNERLLLGQPTIRDELYDAAPEVDGQPMPEAKDSTHETAGALAVKNRRRRTQPLRSAAAGEYLRMGWRTARCLWRRYREADTKQEALFVRGRLERVARFWAAVTAVSVTFLWAAFGFFHGLLCACVSVPPVAYAKQVNKYLTMVPPHVVVTDRAKMFRYQPTAEERRLWECAKKIANFQV